MAGHLIHKLFGSSTLLAPEVGPALGELEGLANERVELAGAIALLRDLLPTVYEEPILDPLPSLAGDDAVARLGAGVPVLRGECLPLDIKGFHRRWLRVCAAIQRHQEESGGKELAEALRQGTLEPSTLTAEFISDGAPAIHARADAFGLDGGLTATVLRLTLFPALARINTALAPVREKVRWEHGYCPTCGRWPLLGEFRGLEQTRFLRCGLCTAEWEFPRLLCPFCETRDHHILGNLHVEGEETRYRAATCDACRGYVKMVTTLAALSGPQLLVTELATLHLDLAALARDYLSTA